MNVAAFDHLRVTFAGDRGGCFPATWGQKDVYRALDAYWPRPIFTVRVTVPVPPGMDRDRVGAALRWAVERHESLRTTYRHHPGGRVEQVVHRTGTLVVDLVRIEDDVNPDAVQLDAHQAPFRPATDLPVRAALLLRHRAPIAVVLEVSRLSLDGAGGRLLRRELARKLHGEPVDARVPPQPADRAAVECSPEGCLTSARAVAQMRAVMESGRLRAFEPAHDCAQPSPRWPRVRMTSPALGAAVIRLASRHRTTTSAVHLALLALLVAACGGPADFAIGVVCSNRWLPDADRYVGTLSQFAAVRVDLRVGDVGELLRSTQRDSLEALANACYDVDELIAGGQPQGARAVDCVFNNNQRGVALRRGNDPVTLLERTEVEDLAPFPPASWRRSVHLVVAGPADVPRLSLCLDRQAVAGVAVGTLLTRMERAVVRLAAEDGEAGTTVGELVERLRGAGDG